MKNSIDDIIAALHKIVENCKATGNPLGYFAVLYRRVTMRVKAGIAAHEFEDNARMERLVVLFAGRYLEAFENFQQNGPVPESWRVAFESPQKGNLIVLQHLFLGINAHINLDLGISAVAAAQPQPLETIKKDFDDINRVLSELVEEMKQKMATVSPAFKFGMPLAQKMDEKLVKFSIEIARDGAWNFARKLHSQTENASLILERDRQIATLAHALARPNWRLQWILNGIRKLEWQSVNDQLRLLERG